MPANSRWDLIRRLRVNVLSYFLLSMTWDGIFISVTCVVLLLYISLKLMSCH